MSKRSFPKEQKREKERADEGRRREPEILPVCREKAEGKGRKDGGRKSVRKALFYPTKRGGSSNKHWNQNERLEEEGDQTIIFILIVHSFGRKRYFAI